MRALKRDLEKAVAEENYENAAALRDQIKQPNTRRRPSEYEISNIIARPANGCAAKARTIRSSSAAASGWRAI